LPGRWPGKRAEWTGIFLDCLILLGTVAECIKAKEKAKTPLIELFPYFFFQKKKP